MSKNLTKTQRNAIELLRARMDPKHPMFSGDDRVVAALHGDAKLYFDTYVIPVLDFLLKGEEFHGQAAYINRDHAGLAARAQARQNAITNGMA